jgi:ABC-type transport system involved in multi-copper enzyme maturation permease subunit
VTAPEDGSQARIRDRGYVPYEGGYTPATTRWLVVARRALASARRQRGVIVLVVLATFPTLISGVAMYLSMKVGSLTHRGTPPSQYVYTLLTKGYGTFLLAMLMAMFAGGGAIADDARAGAFQLYFARPIGREQYLAGKLAGVTALVAAVSLAPATLLALGRLAMAQTGEEALRAAIVPLKAAALGAIESLVLASVVLALSSLGKRRGFVQGGFAALVVLPWMLGTKFAEFTRTPWPQLPSIPTHLDAIGRWLFDVPNDLGDRLMPVWLALAVLAAIVAGAIALVRRRLSSVEVIAS